ncbi:hypothetical protein K438DRAFT_1780231 [Mycena galopus ATCC 62051]|nr:hypothetical protein K438DRAFT_1780231 [Mycena galopus ATCC 62051]
MPAGLERVDAVENDLSLWHSEHFKDHIPTADISAVSNILASSLEGALSSTLTRHLEWSHFFAALIPVQFHPLGAWKMREQLFLGSVVYQACVGVAAVGYIPYSSHILSQNWNVGCKYVVAEGLRLIKLSIRFIVSPGSFQALDLPEDRVVFSAHVQLEEGTINMSDTSWLSQANDQDTDTYRHLLHREGTSKTACAFVRSFGFGREGSRVRLQFPESDQVYWSLDPSGNTRLTQDECDSIGLPRLRFLFLPTARFWHEYHYNAIREFYEGKGFDPYNHEVTRLLGLPLAEMESNIILGLIYRPTERLKTIRFERSNRIIHGHASGEKAGGTRSGPNAQTDAGRTIKQTTR